VSPSNLTDPDDPRKTDHESRQKTFRLRIDRKLKRRRQAQQDKKSPFLGLGVFGIVGWSVTVPTLMGIALGLWIDTTWPSQYSWTLMLLFVGVVLGCLNAWFWIDTTHRGD
jgi:ATP synthase protein I